MHAGVSFRRVWVCVLLAGILWTAAARATNFAILLGGVDSSNECSDVWIDDLTIDIREMTTGLDVDYRTVAQGWRLYGPGQAHWGNAKLALQPGTQGELNTWYQEAAKGKNIRKNITVTLRDHKGARGRTYTLKDCFPTQWSSVEFDTTGVVVQPATLTVAIGGIVFGDETSRQDGPVKGCWVNLDSDPMPMGVDSWSGGEPALLLTPLFANSKFHTTTPGHKSVGEITLRGAMTDGRKAMMTWINDTIAGKGWKRTLTITELLSVDGGVKDGKKTYSYMYCFPVRYVFPRMSVSNTTGNNVDIEKVTVKPIRADLN